jgi:two-component system chemotaxis response regulator CheV
LVKKVERIVNLNWENIHPAPKGSGDDIYLTAVTKIEDRVVEILDVEKILAELAPSSQEYTLTSVDEAKVEACAEQCTRVMVVDDSLVARKQITNCLAKIGLESEEFTDGKQAYRYIQKLIDSGEHPEQHFALIISDIEMPEMDGYDATKAIRKLEKKNNKQATPIIAVTANALKGDKERCISCGMDDYISKPITRESLEDSLRKWTIDAQKAQG